MFIHLNVKIIKNKTMETTLPELTVTRYDKPNCCKTICIMTVKLFFGNQEYNPSCQNIDNPIQPKYKLGELREPLFRTSRFINKVIEHELKIHKRKMYQLLVSEN